MMGLAGMLLETDGQNRKIVVYCVSCKTTEIEMNYHSSKLELLAIVWCVERSRQSLLRNHFKIISDWQALLYLNAHKTVNP